MLCDGCKKDCFGESFFLESSEEDYCPECYKSKNLSGGEYRVKGVSVYIISDLEHITITLNDVIDQIIKESNYPDFFEAARQGNLDALKFHIERIHTNVNSIDFGGNSVLHITCMLRHIDCIKYLLVRGADPHQRDNTNKTPIDFISNLTLRKEIQTYAWYCTPEGKLAYESENVKPEITKDSHIW